MGINNFNKINKVNTIKHKHSDTFIELKQELAFETELQRQKMYQAELNYKQLQNKKEKSLFPLTIINDKTKKLKSKKKRKKSKQNKRNKKKEKQLREEQLKKK